MKRKLVCVFLGLFSLFANSVETSTEKLPVRRVVLYKNGVGYFEHTGRVHGSQDLRIDFTSAQLNDVLKSLTVLDMGGGKISGVGYNSVAPISEQLKALRLPLGETPTLQSFLNALRGSEVEVHDGNAPITGRLLSVEEKISRKGNDETEKTLELSLVTATGEIRTFPFSSSLGLRVADHDLSAEISKYLTLISSARDQDLRQMTISTSGDGDRSVFVSYISEVPVWKSTYRILLPSQPGAKPLLQGWAIVDNTVGEDWNDVELSLVAGAPQSFIQELSKPLYTRRPVVDLPETAMLTPQTHEGTMAYNGLPAPPPPPPPAGTGTGSGGGYGAGAGGIAADKESRRADTFFNASIGNGIYGVVMDPTGAVIANARITATNSSGESRSAYADSNGRFQLELSPDNYSVQVNSPGFSTSQYTNTVVNAGSPTRLLPRLSVGAASETVALTSASEREDAENKLQPAAYGEDLGDLFEYNLKEKVTILKNHSALVPIISSPIQAEKVTLWNADSDHPLRALWITNTSGLTLDGGTFNVVENDAFAGEGLIDPLKPQERRLLSYAVDQAVRVQNVDDLESSPVTHVKITKGVLIRTSEQRDHQVYKLRNADTQEREVIIEHPVRDGWKLTGDLKPEETSTSFYRFRVKVKPNSTAELKVDEVKPLQTTVALSTVTDDQIKVLFREKTLKPDLADALHRIIQQKNEIAGIDREIQTRSSDINSITADQGRLRENMKALKGSAAEKALLERYTRELNDQEDKLQNVRSELAKLHLQRGESQKKLESMLQDLNMDEAI